VQSTTSPALSSTWGRKPVHFFKELAPVQELSPLPVFSSASIACHSVGSDANFFSLYFKLHSRETLWRALEDLFPKFPRCEDSSYSRAPVPIRVLLPKMRCRRRGWRQFTSGVLMMVFFKTPKHCRMLPHAKTFTCRSSIDVAA